MITVHKNFSKVITKATLHKSKIHQVFKMRNNLQKLIKNYKIGFKMIIEEFLSESSLINNRLMKAWQKLYLVEI